MITARKVLDEIRFRIHQMESSLAAGATLPQRIQKEIKTLGDLGGWLEAQMKMDREDHRRSPQADPAELGRIGGRIGGKSTSEAKRRAARENGAKGGRPRKTPA